MSEQLKQQTLYNVSEANTKNLIWVDVYVSGAEGSAGTYASRRMTKAQLITFLNSNLSVAWSTIASKPTTLSGYGITDAVDGSGTTDYVPKWSDSNTLTDSVIRETSGAVGVGCAPDSAIRLKILDTTKIPLQVINQGSAVTSNTTALSVGNNQDTTGYKYGINVLNTGSADQSIGAELRAQNTNNAGKSVGAYISAEGTTANKYAVRLKDGTESAGKFLKCLDSEGYANWASLAISDVASLQTSLDAKAPLNPRVQTVTSSATVTPVSTNDLVTITAQATGLTLANPTGTFVEGQALMIRIKDNGTARTIAFDTNYRAIGITLPTTTVISKTMYLGIIYNSTDAKWDIVGLNQQA